VANLTISIPDAVAPRVLNDLAKFYGVPNDAPSVKAAIVAELKAHCVVVETNKALEDGLVNLNTVADSARADAENSLLLS